VLLALIVTICLAGDVTGGVTTLRAGELSCEILDQGLYVPESKRVRYADAGSVTGERFEIDQVRFVRQTKQIEAMLGQRFGMRYRLVGVTKPVMVTWRVVYPSTVRGAKRWEHRFAASPAGGELVQHLLYQFDVASEMVKGRWDFQVLVDGKQACSIPFEVK